jgi:O-acetyl-ADP-ribose deacetylase (regulator of RNase III)
MVQDAETNDFTGKKCFVIMPFGIKDKIDFNKIYSELIKPTVESLKLECVRSDEETVSGLIQKGMIGHIIGDDLVIVDITTLNANVFYELGIRHTARRSGTILIRRRGQSVPFNIAGMRVFEYETGPAGVGPSRASLTVTINDSLVRRDPDSLVHTLIPGLRVSRRPVPCPASEMRLFAADARSRKEIGIVTGDLIKIGGVDIWVNPENTSMEMARFHDESVSALIRYYGAKRDMVGRVLRDTVADELRRAVGFGSIVEPGTVIPTSAGELRHTNDVKAILHVAGQHGEPGRGYIPVRNPAHCISRVLDAAERLNRDSSSRRRYEGPLKSVIFPLFGTRSAGFDPQDVADRFLHSAKTYLTSDKTIDRVCFLAYTDADLELCETAVKRLGLSRRSAPDGSTAARRAASSKLPSGSAKRRKR